jgi:hypothetical protein
LAHPTSTFPDTAGAPQRRQNSEHFSPIFRQKGSDFAIFDVQNAVLSQSDRGFARLGNREATKGYNVSRETIFFSLNGSHIKFAPS